MKYRSLLVRKLGALELPPRRILVIHVRLKDLVNPAEIACTDKAPDYTALSLDLITTLKELYSPLGILVPTFTYSFTKTGIYDRTNTPSEVGRFGEEIRLAFAPAQRTINPVFSVIDCHSIMNNDEISEDTAFGRHSLWENLNTIGHICLNINLQVPLISTHLHFLEAHHQVPYRYPKTFHGRVSTDGSDWTDVSYEYYMRDLDRDTRWRRDKIAAFLKSHNVLHDNSYGDILLRWFDSTQMSPVIGAALRNDLEFLISDRSSPVITDQDISSGCEK
jgi:aminoglycoside N3'-acetyltransferase